MQHHFHDFRTGNWVLYIPENMYCTIKSLNPKLILSGVSRDFIATFDSIYKIEITDDKLQNLGFDIQDHNCIQKINSGICVSLIRMSSQSYKLCYNGEEFSTIRYIHQVQNAYFDFTADYLEGTLYGVRENRE